MRFLQVVLFLSCFFQTLAQEDSLRQNYSSRKVILGGGVALVTVGSLTYLHDAWYSKHSSGNFHFFNDNEEWQQMDKAGHLFSNYQLSRLMISAFRWAGYKERSALYAGGTLGFFYLTAVEVLDGFSSGWGFSWGDELANGFGCGMAIAQEAAWKEQKLHLKFSYLPSRFAEYNPALLGENRFTRILKDYNAQAYWLSVSPAALAGIKKMQWLCFSLGYGATGMTGGHENNVPVTAENGMPLHFERHRIFLLSLDADLTKIKTRSLFLKGLFSAVNMIKIPFPTIGFSRMGTHFYLVR